MAYSVRADIENTFGAANVSKWADLDNTGDETIIAARIAWAIASADGEIDDKLRGKAYVVPIVGMSGTTPRGIIDLSARYAGVLLYESRGIQEYDPNTGAPAHRLAWHRDNVERILYEIVTGKRKLDAALQITDSSPAVVKELEEDRTAWNVGGD
jgi:hypothetical protein